MTVWELQHYLARLRVSDAEVWLARDEQGTQLVRLDEVGLAEIRWGEEGVVLFPAADDTTSLSRVSV